LKKTELNSYKLKIELDSLTADQLMAKVGCGLCLVLKNIYYELMLIIQTVKVNSN
jgi:hypothetical protein